MYVIAHNAGIRAITDTVMPLASAGAIFCLRLLLAGKRPGAVGQLNPHPKADIQLDRLRGPARYKRR